MNPLESEKGRALLVTAGLGALALGLTWAMKGRREAEEKARTS